ncbi:MAG: isoleucine--tRNA ligase, partial [Nanoarchaeota archaeon]
PFYFMDGPPYASGSIHLGTALNKILKDIAMRSQRMQGKDVFDRPGYDTHGIPIEYQVEKEMGTKSKQDIEKFGVEKFVSRCKDFATRYIDVMNKEFANLGVWMDWKNPYLTLSPEYIEAIWHAFKKAEEKNLLYLGKYSVHVCTRCATAVAYNEIEYGKQKDTSVFVKFPVLGKNNTFLVIWTTTPWTLPANTGVMVHPDFIYQEIETIEGEHWIIAKERVVPLMTMLERGFTLVHEFKGKEMKEWKYENPTAKHTKIKPKNSYRVVLTPRYVTTEEGTGLVHCAPGHGREDYEVGKTEGLAMPCPVGIDGILTEEAGKYAGKKAREVDAEIIEDLEREGFLVHKLIYEHDYPLCWRDKTPLLMLALPQWFLRISGIQKKLIKENEKTHWVPSWAGLRMKAWLEGIGDWPVSRARYWGTPLPIWYNEETGERIVIGSIAELEKLSGKKIKELHKPAIDGIVIPGKKGKPLRRVKEVLDVWFDSGVSSWAALGYPTNTREMKKFWPADLNIEGKDQIRGWWNSQLILSEITFGKKPFKSVAMHGMVLDISKRKMSKSDGNSTTPAEVIERHGRDSLRYLLAKLSKGEDFAFDEKEMSDVSRIFMMVNNIDAFIRQLPTQDKKMKSFAAEDRWIISKYHKLIKEVTQAYNSYRFTEVINLFEQFLVFDLSRTYIQFIRERSNEVAPLLKEIQMGLLSFLAPITPFISEKFWQRLKLDGEVDESSVHLSTFPESNIKKRNENLEKSFETVIKVIEMGNAERDKAKIGLRWPLARATIMVKISLDKELQSIIQRQLNIKSIKIIKGTEIKVDLDTILTPELEAEGIARELTRKIQSERKKAGLFKTQVITLYISSDAKTKEELTPHIHFLLERTNAKKINFVDDKEQKNPIIFDVKGRKIIFSFS